MSAATEMVELYIQAEKDVLEGKTVQMDGRTMTLEDLGSIRRGRKEWEDRVAGEAMVATGQSSLYALADFS